MAELDAFELKTRFGPAVTTVMPAIAFVTLNWGSFGSRLAAVAGLGSLFGLVAAISRALGQARQRALAKSWGGLPTEARIQSNADGNPLIRDRRRALLGQLVDAPLPTAGEEKEQSELSVHRYGAAVKRLQIAARHSPSDAPLVHTELANFNFARNLLGLKPIGLSLAVGAAIAELVRAGTSGWSAGGGVSLFLSTGLALLWVVFIRSKWVKSAGEVYAERLLDALETLVPAAQSEQ